MFAYAPDVQTVRSGARDFRRHLREISRLVRNHRYEVTETGLIFLKDMAAFTGGFLISRHTNRFGDQIGQIGCGHNLITTEGRNNIWDVYYGNGTQTSTWYMSPFTGNATPAAGWTAANYNSNATEGTNYTQAARVEFQEGSAASGSIDNTGNAARFTADTGGITIYGFGVHSVSTKSATSGILAAVERDANAPRTLAESDNLDVEYTFSLTAS